MQAYRKHPIRSERSYNQWRGSTERMRRINMPGIHIEPPKVDKRGVPLNLTEAARTERHISATREKGIQWGHGNSYHPVVRTKGVTFAGDLRQWQGGKLLDVPHVRQIKGGKPAWVTASAQGLLTRQGQSEVKSGRAAYRAAPGEPLRIGGALRGSIKRTDASLSSIERGKIMGYVRAGGESGGQIVDYAGYQEFGTRHNRAHPFLRPALYESRSAFKENVRNSLRGVHLRKR